MIFYPTEFRPAPATIHRIHSADSAQITITFHHQEVHRHPAMMTCSCKNFAAHENWFFTLKQTIKKVFG